MPLGLMLAVPVAMAPPPAFMRTVIDGAAQYEHGPDSRPVLRGTRAVKRARGERVGAAPALRHRRRRRAPSEQRTVLELLRDDPGGKGRPPKNREPRKVALFGVALEATRAACSCGPVFRHDRSGPQTGWPRRM